MPSPSLQHILYVDDEPDMRLLVQLTLENTLGVRVTTCNSAIAALEIAIDEKPQLVVLDAMMPVMDGPAILQEMRRDARLAAIPIIFLTAKTQPAEQQRLRNLGALGVIAKPFALEALGSQVETFWQQHITGRHA